MLETWISFEETPPSAAEMLNRLSEGMREHPWLVATDADGCVLGYAHAGKHRARAGYRWSVDVTVYVDGAHRRKGVGTRLYGGLIEILRRQNFRACFAGVALPNPASVALHDRMGFSHVGIYRDVGFKLGAWRDVAWWRLPLATDEASMSEPIPYSQISD